MSVDWLADPWASGLMRRAFVEVVLAGAVCGALGCFVLVRGLAFLGESIAHTVVLGVAVAFLAGFPMGLGAVAVAGLTVVLVQVIGADRRFTQDTATGVLLPSLFGAGVVLIALSDDYRSRLGDVLFGSVLGVTGADLALAGVVCGLTAAALLLAGKELALVAFDRPLAQAMGYRVALLDLLLLGLVALAVVVALRAVGNVLLTALLLGPPAAARLLCRTFWAMAALAAVGGAAAAVVGLYVTWYLEVGAGPAIVLVVSATFLLAAVAARARSRRARPRRVPALGAVIVALTAGTGCGGSDEPASSGGGSERLRVVATTMQLQDFTRQVGGDRVQVTGILAPGAEPHEYEPTPRDADAVSEASVVVANGAGLDGWLYDLLENAGADAARVDASKGIELLPTEEEGFPGDPHVWHDPQRAQTMVDNVAAGLIRADPGGRAAYEAGAAAYRRKLEAMAGEIRSTFAPVPPERRTLVTSHDAFGYFARAYDVRVVGSVLPSITTESEPSARAIRQLVETIRASGVRTIFTEEAVDPKLERQVAREAGAVVSTSLYADALGAPGSPTGTFIGAELANARAMARAWQAP